MVLLKQIKTEFQINFTLKDILAKPTVQIIGETVDELLWLKTDVKTENSIVI
jgi:hypothetical protein